MAKNFINDGKVIPFVNAVSAVSGGIVVLSDVLHGIADRSGAIGEPNELHRVGQWTLPKGNFKLDVGDTYIADTTTPTAIVNIATGTTNKHIIMGVVTANAVAGATTVDVVLFGT